MHPNNLCKRCMEYLVIYICIDHLLLPHKSLNSKINKTPLVCACHSWFIYLEPLTAKVKMYRDCIPGCRLIWESISFWALQWLLWNIFPAIVREEGCDSFLVIDWKACITSQKHLSPFHIWSSQHSSSYSNLAKKSLNRRWQWDGTHGTQCHYKGISWIL